MPYSKRNEKIMQCIKEDVIIYKNLFKCKKVLYYFLIERGGLLGKKDTVTKEYMRNPAVFADAFNKYLYHGRKVIKPENLRELDSTEIVVPYGSGDASVPEQRYRDVLKTVMTDGNR